MNRHNLHNGESEKNKLETQKSKWIDEYRGKSTIKYLYLQYFVCKNKPSTLSLVSIDCL